MWNCSDSVVFFFSRFCSCSDSVVFFYWSLNCSDSVAFFYWSLNCSDSVVFFYWSLNCFDSVVFFYWSLNCSDSVVFFYWSLNCSDSVVFFVFQFIAKPQVQVEIINASLRYICFHKWSWSYGSWIYNYMCNQCISPFKLWVRIQLIIVTRCSRYNVMS